MSLYQHGGNAPAIAKKAGLERCPDQVIDFSVNVNPLGPPRALTDILLGSEDAISRYPEEYADAAASSLAAHHGVPADQVIVGNGSTEIFGWILQALRPQKAGCITPCYAGYAEACQANDVPLVNVAELQPEKNFCIQDIPDLPSGTGILFLASPNNPTGRSIDKEHLQQIAESNAATTIVLDLSFQDFVPDSEIPSPLPPNVIAVKSLTKFFCIPGLRLGMAWGHSSLIERVSKVQLPWSVNALSQSLARLIYEDADYVRRGKEETASLRQSLIEDLSLFDELTVFPSDANFLLVRLPDSMPASSLQKALLEKGILIRSCGNFEGLGERYCRLAVRPLAEQQELMRALKSVLSPGDAPVHSTPRRTPAVMVVGTTSNAGKSVVAAGLCRLLSRRGVKVAPFKAQNMALNSYVTPEGGEMGRAQVTQAMAAGIDPHTDMNPVLLKPVGEQGSQVIVNGRSIGNHVARDYYAMKDDMRAAAHRAYDRLSADFEAVILEGAGSPAEINLMAEDFVNMDMAAYANAKTILVADIDRGGVFASALGTIKLLRPEHRRLLAGIVINKFRGDPTLLDSGITDLERLTGVPVLGVLPYLRDLKIDEEDSLGLEKEFNTSDTVLDIAVPRLPRISNFTDFACMEHDTGVRIRYVEQASKLGHPHLIIIPGSKNTRADLSWLRDSGLADSILLAHREGTPVFGICGGYQMLGRSVCDPLGVEGPAGETPGLSLLDVETTLAAEKELFQVRGNASPPTPFTESDLPFRGYEIHAGKTDLAGQASRPITIAREGEDSAERNCGAANKARTVFGCYIHGMFDSKDIRRALYSWLCAKHSIDSQAVEASEANPVAEFDRVADVLEDSLDLRALLDHCAG